jgi:hypothetical protein
MMRRSPLNPGKPLARKTPLKAVGFKRGALKEAGAVRRVRMKSRGMKGRAPTAEEQRFMDAIASLGCLACAKDGITNPWISLHHIDGRTKPGAHMLVLPLCGPHHQQDDTDPLGRISVHGNKARFEARYGAQLELLAEAKERLGLI